MVKLNFSRVFLLASLLFCFMQVTMTVPLDAESSGEHRGSTGNANGVRNVHSGEVTNVLSKMPRFASRYMKKINWNFKAMSPAGLFFAFGMLYNLAEEGTPGYLELASELDLSRNSIDAYRLKDLNDYLGELDVTSINVFYSPTKPEESVSGLAINVFKQSGTVSVNTEEALKSEVDKQTKGLVPDLKIENPDKMHIINVITLQFEWFRKFKRSTEETTFEGKSTHFITSTGLTKTLSTDKFRAVQLTFADKKSPEKLVENNRILAYLIDTKGKKLTAKILNEVHEAMQDTTEGEVTVEIPGYKLESKIELGEGQYSQLLRDGTTDFPSLNAKKISITQNTNICVDEKGTIARSISDTEVSLYSGLTEQPFIMQTAFYHVIVEASSGAPLFIGHVTEASDEPCK